jgi:hypothetical protein
MKTKEFDIIMNEVLAEETKKLIMEQISNNVDTIKNFQSISGLSDKIVDIVAGRDVIIKIEGITPEELVDCCGGKSLGNAQTNLMQGLHHDLEENGFDGDYDIDVDTQGDENSLNLTIKITANDNELSKEQDMDEVEDNGELSNSFGQPMCEDGEKDTNPEVKDKKEVILGDKEIYKSDKSKESSKTLKKMNENTSRKKTIQLSESEMGNLLSKIIKEAVEKDINEHHMKDKPSQIAFICKNDKTCKKEDLEKLSSEEVEKKYLALEKKMGLKEQIETPANIASPSNGVPGIDVTRKNHKDSGKENSDALKAVEKKIKEYLSFDGNTDPEFPEPIGKGKQKVATKNTDSENDVVDLNRGRNTADLTYDQEPSEQFKKRAKLSLVGASEMGNSQDAANVIPSKTGENIAKVAEKRKEARVNEPIYDKESVPVKESPKKTDRPGPESGNAGDAVASDILRMKQMSNYKEKTQ